MSNGTDFPSGEAGPAFPQTRWSRVAEAAGEGPAAAARPALDRLLRLYLPALRTHLLRDRRVPEAEADDLLQGFVADKVLGQDLLAAADRTRGKFRTFLLAALGFYLVDRRRHDGALKRRPGGAAAAGNGAWVSLHDDAGRAAALAAPAQSEAHPAAAFERAWAEQALGEAVARMRRECLEGGKVALWEVFDGRIVGPALHGLDPADYGALVERFRLRSVTQAANLLITAKRMFVRVLRAVLLDHGVAEGQVEQEMDDLREILARGA